MLTSSTGCILPMIYRFPSNEMLEYNDHYRIEGGYNDPTQWIIQTKIAPVECRIQSDNVASIYSNYFYDQVRERKKNNSEVFVFTYCFFCFSIIIIYMQLIKNLIP